MGTPVGGGGWGFWVMASLVTRGRQCAKSGVAVAACYRIRGPSTSAMDRGLMLRGVLWQVAAGARP